ncbi:MAG: hypothetical protein FD174_3472 [Geobacteraceae bacterium]|nr:MAG: hypothetical protein FD174_3472 [Geobacteraceae bacterium]
MKAKIVGVLVVVASISIFCTISKAGEILLIEIDGRKNCCLESNHNKCSKDITLSAGKYIITPHKGAISRWGNDKTANKQGEHPWEFFVNVEAGNEIYGLGSLVRYGKADEAFEKQKTQKIDLDLNVNSVVRFWVEDEWEGRDYCRDNRGIEEVKIEKVY